MGACYHDMAVESIAPAHSAVGSGIGAMKADAARTVLEDAPAVEFYRQHPEKNYPYEVLEGNEIVKEVVDLWLQVGLFREGHAQRLTKQREEITSNEFACISVKQLQMMPANAFGGMHQFDCGRF